MVTIQSAELPHTPGAWFGLVSTESTAAAAVPKLRSQAAINSAFRLRSNSRYCASVHGADCKRPALQVHEVQVIQLSSAPPIAKPAG